MKDKNQTNTAFHNYLFRKLISDLKIDAIWCLTRAQWEMRRHEWLLQVKCCNRSIKICEQTKKRKTNTKRNENEKWEKKTEETKLTPRNERKIKKEKFVCASKTCHMCETHKMYSLCVYFYWNEKNSFIIVSIFEEEKNEVKKWSDQENLQLQRENINLKFRLAKKHYAHA